MIVCNARCVLARVKQSVVQKNVLKCINYYTNYGIFQTHTAQLLQARGPRFTKHACTLLTTNYCCEKEVFRERENVKTELKTYIEGRKERLKDAEERLKERSRVMLSDIKETKQKVKGKVEEIIERENIYTVPNLLCVGRILITPYLGMLIIQSDFDLALGVLGFAALTDLVSV